MQTLSLSQPLLIKDKSVIGVLLPNTKASAAALEKFILELTKDEFDEWDKELSSPAARARYASIIADADSNDGWISGEKMFNDLRKARKESAI